MRKLIRTLKLIKKKIERLTGIELQRKRKKLTGTLMMSNYHQCIWGFDREVSNSS